MVQPARQAACMAGNRRPWGRSPGENPPNPKNPTKPRKSKEFLGPIKTFKLTWCAHVAVGQAVGEGVVVVQPARQAASWRCPGGGAGLQVVVVVVVLAGVPVLGGAQVVPPVRVVAGVPVLGGAQVVPPVGVRRGLAGRQAAVGAGRGPPLGVQAGVREQACATRGVARVRAHAMRTERAWRLPA